MTMLRITLCTITMLSLFSCKQKSNDHQLSPQMLTGTWQLVSSLDITKNDTVVSTPRTDQRMIKVLNGTHFAFFKHDLQQGRDSASAVFNAGAGTYTLAGNNYTEHLEYCTGRAWENKDFSFTISLHNDTLTQRGVEKIESLHVDHEIVEVYVRSK